MDSAGNKLWCNHCKKEWTLTELGSLKAVDCETEFERIPDWYEFQRLEVRRQIEAGTYEVNDEVDVDALPNAKGYINLGRGRLTHNLEGFKLDVRNGLLKLEKTPTSMYSCHIEYNYDLRGDCIDLSTLMDTYYVYPMSLHCCVTKIALATEELFSFHQRQAARPI